jgi:hypothetical protein
MAGGSPELSRAAVYGRTLACHGSSGLRVTHLLSLTAAYGAAVATAAV